MSSNDTDYQFQLDSTANLLAASVSELAGCSSDAAYEVEMSIIRALKDAPSYQVKAIYAAVHHAFNEDDTNEND
jgi:hypothetical protein